MDTLFHPVPMHHNEEADRSRFLYVSRCVICWYRSGQRRPAEWILCRKQDTSKDTEKDAGELPSIYDLGSENAFASAGSGSGKDSAKSSLRSQ